MLHEKAAAVPPQEHCGQTGAFPSIKCCSGFAIRNLGLLVVVSQRRVYARSGVAAATQSRHRMRWMDGWMDGIRQDAFSLVVRDLDSSALERNNGQIW